MFLSVWLLTCILSSKSIIINYNLRSLRFFGFVIVPVLVSSVNVWKSFLEKIPFDIKAGLFYNRFSDSLNHVYPFSQILVSSLY